MWVAVKDPLQEQKVITVLGPLVSNFLNEWLNAYTKYYAHCPRRVLLCCGVMNPWGIILSWLLRSFLIVQHLPIHWDLINTVFVLWNFPKWNLPLTAHANHMEAPQIQVMLNCLGMCIYSLELQDRWNSWAFCTGLIVEVVNDFFFTAKVWLYDITFKLQSSNCMSWSQKQPQVPRIQLIYMGNVPRAPYGDVSWTSFTAAIPF